MYTCPGFVWHGLQQTEQRCADCRSGSADYFGSADELTISIFCDVRVLASD